MKGPQFRKSATNKVQDQDYANLFDALLLLKSRDECQRFLTDLCTPAELLAFAERWKVARILDEGKLSYRDIHTETGVSITTVGRVARFLMQEPHQGYATVLNRIKAKEKRKA